MSQDPKERRKQELEDIKARTEEDAYTNEVLGKSLARAYWVLWDALVNKVFLDVSFEILVEIKMEELTLRMSSKDKDVRQEEENKKDHEHDIQQKEWEKLNS